jgi:N-acetyl-anhydromuramyl-L-alanine amidase AmpD
MDTLKSVDFIIIHCTATREDVDYSVDQLRRDHRKRGFEDIGYHFYIKRDGSLTQPRHIYQVGAHCRPYNYNSIGVCYEGGLRADGAPADTRTEAQKAKMKEVVLNLLKVFPNAVVRGHRDMKRAVPKLCPCFDVASDPDIGDAALRSASKSQR